MGVVDVEGLFGLFVLEAGVGDDAGDGIAP